MHRVMKASTAWAAALVTVCAAVLGVLLVPPASAAARPAVAAAVAVTAGPPKQACSAMEALARSKKVQGLDLAMAKGQGVSSAYHQAVPALRTWYRNHRADLPARQRRAARTMVKAGQEPHLTISRIENLARPIANFMYTRCGIRA